MRIKWQFCYFFDGLPISGNGKGGNVGDVTLYPSHGVCVVIHLDHPYLIR